MGLTPDSTLANICQTRLRSDCWTVRVCLHCCRSMMRDTVRNNDAKAAPVSGTTLRFTGPVPADSRQ